MKQVKTACVLGALIVTFCVSMFSCSNNVLKVDDTSDTSAPNFILILADDQGWNGTSVQMMADEPLSKSDYHETPYLESLASQGMRFSHAYASAPVCAPSRYSIQFGKTPARLSLIRVGMNSDHIQHETWTSIPKALKSINSNYVAAHFGKWGMGSLPEVLGYDQSDGPTQNKEGGFVNNKSQWDYTTTKDPKRIFSLTDQAVSFLEEATSNQTPFYLQISHYAVHSSLQMQASSLENFQSKAPGSHHKDAGLASMTYDLDQGLGVLMSKIKDLGIDDNTYIIYMSDNGSVPNIPGAKKYQESYNFPLSRGKWDAMEGGIRVPLVIAGPGIEPMTESTAPVSGSDLLPTITALAGDLPNQLDEIDGGSFKHLLLQESNNAIDRSVDGLFFHVPYENGIAFKRAHSAVRKGDMKLIRFQDNGELQLYNVVQDKMEMNNLSDSLPAIALEMEKTLLDYLKSVHAPKWKEGITWKEKPLSEFNSTY